MMQTIDYIILGIYTVIYLIVFILQQKQIKSQKETSSKMAELLNLFDMEKIKSYVRLSEDEARMAAQKFIREELEKKDNELKELKEEIAKNKPKIKIHTNVASNIVKPQSTIKEFFNEVRRAHPGLWKGIYRFILVETDQIEAEEESSREEDLVVLLEKYQNVAYSNYHIKKVDSNICEVVLSRLSPDFKISWADYILSDYPLDIQSFRNRLR